MNNEAELLFDKRYTCPICGKEVKAKNVKTGKAKFVNTDIDLRPIYSNIDILKYDIVLCNYCGYAALTKYFDSVTSIQKKNIEEKISSVFKQRNDEMDSYSYKVALERYKLALVSVTVKDVAASEKGYLCLKISWLMQNRAKLTEELDEEEKERTLEEAQKYSVKALELLTKARMEEDYPICGMDEPTLDYLLAALSYQDNQLDFASRMLSNVSVSREASDRLKDKAYDLKQKISEKSKEE